MSGAVVQRYRFGTSNATVSALAADLLDGDQVNNNNNMEDN